MSPSSIGGARRSVLTAVYDLAVGPVSYDFVVFLVKADMARRKAKADKLHVVIVPYADGVAGMFRDKTVLYDKHEMRWRLWNIVIPACQLMDASVTLATDWAQVESMRTDAVWPQDWRHQTLKNRRHLVGDIIAEHAKGTYVPMLQASPAARRAVRDRWDLTRTTPLVTMTMRKTYFDGRNTDDTEWWPAKNMISAGGYQVVVLRDVSEALLDGGGYGEYNLDLRMALYQEAALNLQANNGAASLCWFSDKPYRMFDAGVGSTRDEWEGLFVRQGLPWGASWPWAQPQQKIIYERSTSDVIIREFEAWAGVTK